MNWFRSTLVEAKHTQSDKDFFSFQPEHLPLDCRANEAVTIQKLALKSLMNPVVLSIVLGFCKPSKEE